MTNGGHIPETLDSALAAARRQYAALRDALEQRLAASFADTSDVAYWLLSSEDEFGREHAGQLLAERPRDWGQWSGHGDWRAASIDIQRDLDAMATPQNRIDELTAQRANLDNGAPTEPHRVHIQGWPYDSDTERRELREVVSGSRFVVELEQQAPEREIALLEQLAEDSPPELALERPKPIGREIAKTKDDKVNHPRTREDRRHQARTADNYPPSEPQEFPMDTSSLPKVLAGQTFVIGALVKLLIDKGVISKEEAVTALNDLIIDREAETPNVAFDAAARHVLTQLEKLRD